MAIANNRSRKIRFSVIIDQGNHLYLTYHGHNDDIQENNEYKTATNIFFLIFVKNHNSLDCREGHMKKKVCVCVCQGQRSNTEDQRLKFEQRFPGSRNPNLLIVFQNF
jgi:hypothetical protein